MYKVKAKTGHVNLSQLVFTVRTILRNILITHMDAYQVVI